MTSADNINDQGEIVGRGTLPNGDQRTFLLTRSAELQQCTYPPPSGPADRAARPKRQARSPAGSSAQGS
jgi:hypothetical protein